jgi:penicillin-binding protein 1C
MEFGGDSPLRFDFPVACKTGTSTSFRDNWAMAYTPEFSVGVWAGNFDGSPMHHVSGVAGAAPVLHEIVEFLHSSRGTTWFETPDQWQKVMIDPHLGKRSNSSACVEEWFPLRSLPAWVDSGDFDSDGKVRLDSRYNQWIGEGPSRFAASPPERLLIHHPRPNTRFVLDPEVPGSQWIPLRGEGPNPLEWEGEGMRLVKRGGMTLATGTAGVYEIVARDSATGESVRVRVELIQK